MSKLPTTKFVIAILAIGILLAATTATVMSAGLKPFNQALAQIRFPFQTQPQVRAPVQQAPVQQPTGPATAAVVAPSSSSATFGPNCVGCISTQNLKPDAVSITTQVTRSEVKAIDPGSAGVADAFCSPGSVITGGGYTLETFGREMVVLFSGVNTSPSGTGWRATVANNGNSAGTFDVEAVCTTVHP